MKKTGSIKPRQVGEISVNEWLQAVYASQSAKEDEPPKGSITVDQFRNIFTPPLCQAVASSKLNLLVKKGLAKRIACRRICGASGIKVVPYFLLTK